MIPTSTVPDVLTRAREAVTPALASALDRLSVDLRQLTTYHLGWTDLDGRPAVDGGGKGIRPALAILSAEAARADGEVGVPGAVAVELIHNFSLIHDDVIDGDRTRRHRPTVWAVAGVGQAIVVGDALATLAHQVLLDVPEGGPAARCLADATAAMIAGQADDITFESRHNISLVQCMAMTAGKTGALLGCAASIGAVLAGASPLTITALRDYGTNLGIAFQAVDDLLGIWGDPERTGKPAGNDLRQRKKTLPIVAALGAGNEDAQELHGLLAEGPLNDEQIARATWLVEVCDARSWTANRAKTHLDRALQALERVRMNPMTHRELTELAAFVVERES
ncbi:MAG TPA: polyprenyl synthetase family protein [Acidimicrobiales bacterium]|nr:polyprenyl synthetase family protein [Acidimicrobiales bacterium]